MLRHLQIEDYALIDRLEIEFHPGLNLLTGETGSGKSIVVDAVALLLGERASSDQIRSGAERARIVGIFSESTTAASAKPRDARGDLLPRTSSGNRRRWSRVAELLEAAGIEMAEDEDLIVQREILPAGRSRVFINNQPATVGLLKSLAPCLAEVHGQNEQQELFEPRMQMEFLDRFGNLAEAVGGVSERYEQWKSALEQLEQARREQQQWIQQRDLWRYQQREIEQAAIAEGEEERLEEEKRMLAHAERIQSRLAACYDLLYDAPGSAIASLGAVQRHLGEVLAYDEALASMAEALETAKAAVEDLALTLRDRLGRLESRPGRLEEIENRLAHLDRLKRKYAASLAEIAHYGRELRQRIERLESGEARIEELEAQAAAAAKQYQTAAVALSAQRAKAAKALKRAVEKELHALAMPGTIFEAHLEASPEQSSWRAAGLDAVEFLLSPNPGEPLRPLNRIASGGEVSRIMLALETVIAQRPAAGNNPNPSARSESPVLEHTLIFDEVDSGIGGRAAETVGRRLRRLGESRQVLCVTHLPQIASFAHHHYRVDKVSQGGRTITAVQYLTTAERKSELARMLSGTQVTAAILEHAEQLLKANAG